MFLWNQKKSWKSRSPDNQNSLWNLEEKEACRGHRAVIFSKVNPDTCLKDCGCQDSVFLSLLHTTSHSSPTHRGMTGGDRRYPVAQVEAGEPENLGIGPEAQGKAFCPSTFYTSPTLGTGTWADCAEQARDARLTLRTGVRYSATSRAFPFTVLITFCILGLEQRWGREGQSRSGPGTQKLPRTWTTGIEPRRRHPQGGGGGAAARGGRAQLSPGGEGRGPAGRARGGCARSPLAFSPKLPFASRLHFHPFRLPLPLFTLPTAAPPPGPHVTPVSPDTWQEPGRGGGTHRSFLTRPAPRTRRKECACAMVADAALLGRPGFRFGSSPGGRREEGFCRLCARLIRSPSMGPESLLLLLLRS